MQDSFLINICLLCMHAHDEWLCVHTLFSYVQEADVTGVN